MNSGKSLNDMRRRQLKALDELEPWKVKDHPELKQGAAEHVRKLRREYERRFKKVIPLDGSTPTL